MTKPTFAKDIRPLFRDKDIDSMKKFGNLDLSNYDDVKKHAEEILLRVSEGTMPCDQEWSVTLVETFKEWMNQDMVP